MFKYLKRDSPLLLFGAVYFSAVISALTGYLLKLIFPNAAISLDLAILIVLKYIPKYSILSIFLSTVISSVFSSNPAIIALIFIQIFKGRNPILLSISAVTFIFVLNVVAIGPHIGGPIVAQALLNRGFIDMFCFFLDHIAWGLTFGLLIKYVVGIEKLGQSAKKTELGQDDRP